MDFSLVIAPKINKEYILSKISQYDIFSYYFNTKIVPKKLYRSEIRRDKNPTVGFYLNKNNDLIYHDFGSGEFYNCFGYVARLYGVSYFEALKIIAKDFNLIEGNFTKQTKKIVEDFPKQEKITSIRVEIKDFTEYELKWWNSFGITKDILNKFRVYSCKTVFLNGNIYAQSAQHSPIYGYYLGKKENVEQWRIYMPKRKEFRFIGNVPTKTIQGYKQLAKKGKLLIITKSMKDTMTLYSLGISAIAPNSETQFIADKMLEDLKTRFKYIVVMYDNDIAGISNMRKIKKEHPELVYFWIPRKYEAKDISDFYHKYSREKTIEFIKENLIKLKNLDS